MTALLVMAATLRVVLPTFDVDHVPGVLGQGLPDAYASAIESVQCASPLSAGKLGPQARAAFAACAESNHCFGDVGRTLGADFVVRGKISRTDATYLIHLTVFDVRAYEVRKNLEQRYDGKLSGLTRTVTAQIGELCHFLNPDWKDTRTDQALAALQFESPTAGASEFGELPPMVEPVPPAPALAPHTSSAPFQPMIAPAMPLAGSGAPARAPVSTTPRVAEHAQTLPLMPVTTPPRRRPWGLMLGGAAVVVGAIAIGLGVESSTIWNRDHLRVVNGILEHSLSHPDALQGNRDAYAADAMFGVAAATAIGAGGVIYFRGLGIGGRF